jgi:glycerol uptake facilitator-like aquaporin
VACIYIGWEVGGYMIDLIWYLSVITISYILGTLTNSKLNPLYNISNLVLIYYNPILGGWLHGRSNLVLMCYNHILSVRNSNLSLLFQ